MKRAEEYLTHYQIEDIDVVANYGQLRAATPPM